MADNTLLDAVSDRSGQLQDHSGMLALVAVEISTWRSLQQNQMPTVSGGDYYGG